MFNDLMPHWLSPFCYWIVLTTFYLLSNKWVSNELKDYEYPIRWTKSIFYILSVSFLSLISTSIFHSIFMYRIDIDEDEYKILERFKWEDLFVISIVPALTGVLVAIIKHNKVLLKLYSKEIPKTKFK